MKRYYLLTLAIGISVVLGLVGGSALSARQQPERNYMAIVSMEVGPGMSINDGISRTSEWVRILRETGKYDSVRLFLHEWGPETGIYLLLETTDWGALGTTFADVAAADPAMVNEPWGFVGHSDNLVVEIPVE